ncbi:MAG: FtsX-like permease family protein, partial [Ruminiclostridium sp.]|nr:FtsX-like permease family protein [Ruminiclostridium sp.]
KAPVMELLKGKSIVKIKEVKFKGEASFLKDMKNAVIRGRKSFVFFIGFAAFCYSSMVQMFFGMDTLGNEATSVMILMIGITLAFTTLFIAVTSVVKANGKNVAVMRAFGYSSKECRQAVINGYRPAALVGFVIGTFYQYILLKIMVTVVFKDVENVPEYGFDFKALIITLITFVIVYELVMYLYGRKIGKLSLKEVMLDSE